MYKDQNHNIPLTALKRASSVDGDIGNGWHILGLGIANTRNIPGYHGKV